LEPEESLPCSQEPATCFGPERDIHMVDGMILKWTCYNYGLRMWTGLKRLSVYDSRLFGLLASRNDNFLTSWMKQLWRKGWFCSFILSFIETQI